jgi:hypothetical protein
MLGMFPRGLVGEFIQTLTVGERSHHVSGTDLMGYLL